MSGQAVTVEGFELPGKSTPVREASEWFALIQATEDPPAEVLQAWLSWLEESPEHQQTFENIARIWHGTDASVVAQPGDTAENEGYDDAISVKQWRTNRLKPARPAAGDDWRAGRWRRPLLAVAATVLMTLSTFIAYKQLGSNAGKISTGEFATRTGEHLELVLADGSRVTLGGQSKLAVHFTSSAREVRLDSGEAFFSVRKDPARAFTVFAQGGAIRALGTAFNVHSIEDRVTVTVTEGAVRVAAEDIGVETFDSGTLGSGQELVYRAAKPTNASQPMAIKQVDPAESVRWLGGWLMYHDEPLRYVIADLARYTDLKLNVSGAAADLQFSGAIYKDRIAEWIVALPEVSPVKLEKKADHLTIAPRD